MERSDEQFLKAVKSVGGLAGYKLKSVATMDDFEVRTLTLKITRSSAGVIQDDLFDLDHVGTEYNVGPDGNVEVPSDRETDPDEELRDAKTTGERSDWPMPEPGTEYTDPGTLVEYVAVAGRGWVEKVELVKQNGAKPEETEAAKVENEPLPMHSGRRR